VDSCKKNKVINNIIIESQINNKTKKRNKKKKSSKHTKKSINYKEINEIKNGYNNINTTNNETKTKKTKTSQNSKSLSMLNPIKFQPELIAKVKNIMKYTDDEINGLSYELAMQYDKRTYFQYYISLIKTKHNFIYTFVYNDDYNTIIIKIDSFFVNFAMLYALNGLFFDDDSMHKIYVNKGKYDFLNELPKMIYSQIISMVLNIILQILALPNDTIIDFKQNKTKKDLFHRKKK
jgi:hypothetical protein